MKLIRAADDLVGKLKDASNRQGKSLSHYVTKILERAARTSQSKEASSVIPPSGEGPRQTPNKTPYKKVSKPILTLESESIAKAHERITDEMTRVVGNISIPDGQEIKKSMVTHGDLTLGSKCHVYGNLTVFGEVGVGEESVVEGNILAAKRIFIGRNVKVAGIVDSGEDIVLEENVTVDAVSTERSVTLASGAKINRRVVAGESLLTKPSLVKKLEAELPEKEKETEEAINDESRFFKSLQEQMERLMSLRKREVDQSILKELSLKEAGVYNLAVRGRSVEEIGLRLSVDPVEVQGILNSLIHRHYLDEYLRPVKTGGKVAETATQMAQHPKDLSVEEVFEQLLASKIRPDMREKTRRGTEEHEKLTTFLSELSETPTHGKPKVAQEKQSTEESETSMTPAGFQMKVSGEIFHPGDGVTAVIGDVEIPDGSIVDKPLVVKGKITIGANCQILQDLKALGGILMAGGCSVKARISSGSTIEVGKNTIIEGDVHTESSIKLFEGAKIFGLVDAGGAYVSVENSTSDALGRGKEPNGEHNH